MMFRTSNFLFDFNILLAILLPYLSGKIETFMLPKSPL